MKLDRAAIAQHRLRVRDVAETLETAFSVQVVSRVLEGGAAFDLLVRYDESAL